MSANEEKETMASEELRPEVDESDAEERSQLEAYLKEAEERLKIKAEQRKFNDKDTIKYPEESFFVKLDSSVKKNSAFVKKLKNMTEAQKDSILKDMNGLNLSKYVSEVASAIVEAKLKMSDINMAIKICSLLHQRYPDFSSQLLEAWVKIFPKKVTDLQTINPSKMRIDLRLFAELVSSGIFKAKEGLPVLGNLLILLTANDKENHNNLNILLTFCRHCGDDYAGLVPRKMLELSRKFEKPLPNSDFLPADRQKGLRNLLKDYYKSLVAHLLRDHKALQNQERQNRKTLMSKGELSNERKEKYEQAQVALQKMLNSAQQMADLLSEDFPHLVADVPDYLDDMDEAATINLDVSNRFKTTSELEGSALWEDEDTRSFYENLPDLKALVPSILYKDSVKDGAREAKTSETKEEKSTSEPEKDDQNANECQSAVETLLDEKEEDVNDAETDADDDVNNATLEEDGNISGTDEDSSRENQSSEPQKGSKSQQTTQANKVMLESFLTSLVTCVNRDMIDKSALNFCTSLNTKYNRKKLVRALFAVPRTRLDLLPFYARLVATLAPLMPHVATDLVQLLKQDFKFHIRKKDQINIESKIKNVRFIGELVKFNVYPKSEALHCLKLLLLDFSHHQIEMACNLLETCGRFLYRSADSHHKCKLLLEQMMRKKALLPYDSRYITMVENAYYFANPPESQMITRVERPPMHEYIRTLLYKDLCKTNIDKILRQLRKLNWEDSEIAFYCLKCFIAVWNVKFYNIRCVANLLAGLKSFQEWVVPIVVDGVIEDIRLGMEINHPKYNQRRISMMRYLGEMYNYRLVDSSVIFKELYSLITYGIYYDIPGVYSELDPPDNLFRIRLVCQLLETCGPYIYSLASKRKFDAFLVFFQRFFWFKKSSDVFNDDYPFPVSIDFLFKDCVQLLKDKFVFVNSYEEALKAVENLMNELKPKLRELYPGLNIDDKTDEKSFNEEESRLLNPIAEVDEEMTEPEREDSEGHLDDDADSEEEFSEHDRSLARSSKNQLVPTTDEGSDTEIEREHLNISRGISHERRKAAQLVVCPEDDEFQKDFERLMSESIVSRSQETVRSQVNDIVIPMNKVTVAKKAVAFSEDGKISRKDGGDASERSTFNLMVMTRARGNKAVLKPVEVPVDSDLALTIREKEEAERAEKEQVKKLTLDINERREMEDEFTEKANSPLVMNLNRDVRRKYQHPRGAPDADLIFGNRTRINQ